MVRDSWEEYRMIITRGMIIVNSHYPSFDMTQTYISLSLSLSVSLCLSVCLCLPVSLSLSVSLSLMTGIGHIELFEVTSYNFHPQEHV